jgi:hypothetical protein
MDLAESGRDIFPYQFHGAIHGLGGGCLPPGMGTKMIAADQHILQGIFSGSGQGLNESDEFCGPHAGVTAELVDLVCGGFHQEHITVSRRLFDGGLQNGSVCRTDGGYAPYSAG